MLHITVFLKEFQAFFAVNFLHIVAKLVANAQDRTLLPVS